MSRLKFGDRTYNMPRSRVARMTLGIALVIGGLLGFLPILGFWMIPLGLLVLSVDLPSVRRARRQWTVKLGTWLSRNYPKVARKLGVNGNSKRTGRPDEMVKK